MSGDDVFVFEDGVDGTATIEEGLFLLFKVFRLHVGER